MVLAVLQHRSGHEAEMARTKPRAETALQPNGKPPAARQAESFMDALYVPTYVRWPHGRFSFLALVGFQLLIRTSNSRFGGSKRFRHNSDRLQRLNSSLNFPKFCPAVRTIRAKPGQTLSRARGAGIELPRRFKSPSLPSRSAGTLAARPES